MIVVVDYGMGNLGSIHNMLSRLGAASTVTSQKEEIAAADKLILPGVGAFDTAMDNLRSLDLIELLNEKVITKKTKILGICLGMQLMSLRSEEGVSAGLGWVEADTVRLPSRIDGQMLRVPHMGWNTITTVRTGSILDNIDPEPRFYFVHSYHVRCRNESDVLATASHGLPFHAALWHDNIIGTQFHPEKSHRFGLQLFRNFIAS